MSKNRYSIAAVDDEFDVRELLRYNLTKAGFAVFTYSNAIQALREIKHSKPDLILTDWLMPGMDGIEFCRNIKHTPEISSTPVIMITCNGEDKDKLLASEIGVTDYFVKPFPISELVERIRILLNQPDVA